MSDDAIIIDTPDGIEAYRLLAIKGRLWLELKGIHFKPLPGYGSTFSYVKKTYGFKGPKVDVYYRYVAMLKERGVLSEDVCD
jgi:hypothetical protein